MIISDQYGFLFVENLRTASSSLHQALRPLASVALGVTAAGKHLSLAEIYERFGAETVAPLYKCAVIREPVSYLWSLYRFHKRPGFDGQPHSTRDLSFEAFYSGDTHGWMRVPQAARFADPSGEYGLDLLIRFEDVSAGFSYLKFRLGLPNLLLPMVNTSDPSRPEVSPELAERIRADYAVDTELSERCGNHERTEEGFVPILVSTTARVEAV